MIKWQSVVVRPNKLFIGNSRLVSYETLTEVISLATIAPSITRKGPGFDVCNKERSWLLFKEHCRSVAASLLVFALQGKEGVSPQHHLETAISLGVAGELLVLVVEEMREQNNLNRCSFSFQHRNMLTNYKN